MYKGFQKKLKQQLRNQVAINSVVITMDSESYFLEENTSQGARFSSIPLFGRELKTDKDKQDMGDRIAQEYRRKYPNVPVRVVLAD